MRPAKDSAALSVIADDVIELSPLERRFVEEYFGGEFRHNGVRSYIAASGNPNYNTASTEATRLLRLPRVRAYLRSLHMMVIAPYIGEAVAEWKPLVEKAKALLHAHLDGVIKLTGTDVGVIREVLDRGVGKPKASVEHEVGEKLDALIRDLASKRKSLYLRQEPIEVPLVVALGDGQRNEEPGRDQDEGGST